MYLFALDAATAGIAAVAGVASSFVLGLLGAFDRRRRTGDAHFRMTIQGFEDLLGAQERRVDELEAEVEDMKVEVATARRESMRANLHAAECERELRAAKSRITQLEGAA